MAAAGKAEAGNGACTGIKNGVSLKAGSGFIPGGACSSVTGAVSCRLWFGKKGCASCFSLRQRNAGRGAAGISRGV
jgi:hypothetical protein